MAPNSSEGMIVRCMCYNSEFLYFQAVSIVEGKKSVDVGVSLCYCNSDLCNQVVMTYEVDGGDDDDADHMLDD